MRYLLSFLLDLKFGTKQFNFSWSCWKQQHWVCNLNKKLKNIKILCWNQHTVLSFASFPQVSVCSKILFQTWHNFLGSTGVSAGDTFLRAGSLLDDNQWHDVKIVRNNRQVNFTVDRLTITNMTNGDFYQLDLDRQVLNFYILF